MTCVVSGHDTGRKSSTANKRQPRKKRITRRGFAPPPIKVRVAPRKPSPELVEVLMLAGCTHARILELTGCTRTTLAEDEYPDLRRGPRSATVRTANLLAKLLELGEASKEIPDVERVLKIFCRLHLPEVSAALDGAPRAGNAGQNPGAGGVLLYLPDNGRGPNVGA